MTPKSEKYEPTKVPDQEFFENRPNRAMSREEKRKQKPKYLNRKKRY